MSIKVGDKIKCNNGHTYIIGEGENNYDFSLIDEFGEIVNLYNSYPLNDCLPIYEEDQHSLRVGNDYLGKVKYTYIIEHIEC